MEKNKEATYRVIKFLLDPIKDAFSGYFAGHQPSLGGINRETEVYGVDNRWWNAIYEKEMSGESFTPASRKCTFSTPICCLSFRNDVWRLYDEECKAEGLAGTVNL